MIRRYARWLLLNIFWVILAYTFIVGFASFWVGRATAQDTRAEHDAGHMQYHPAYSTWAIPGGAPGSCCNMRVRQADGSVTGDCYPTEFQPVTDKEGRFDHWRARLDDYDGGQWVDVPNERVIREKNPDPSGVSGHLCYGHEAKHIYCAVPPASTL